MYPQTFTNNIGASVTVDDNGVYPMFKVSTGIGASFAVLTDKHLPEFLRAVISRSSQFGRKVKHITLDGKPSIKAGEGGSAGVVYKPTTQDQADRNLNFALANLEAHVWWETTGKKEAEAKAKREAELKEAEARRAKELAEANLRRIEAEEADGIRAYNKAMGTSYRKFSDVMFMGSNAKREWIAIGKAQKQIDRDRAIISPIRAYDPFAPRLTNTTRPWL